MVKLGHRQIGFTIVELLVVIVVIGILATVSVVSFSGIRKQAVIISIKSDMDGAKKQLEIYQIEKGAYPEIIDCGVPSEKSICLQLSTGNRIDYYRATTSPMGYYLTISNGQVAYNTQNNSSVNEDSDIGAGDNLALGKTCPTDFILVPANGAFGTANDFCVMKYEAKLGVNGIVSKPEDQPLVRKPQEGPSSATSLSQAHCLTCRLISEAEWLTIANNIFYNETNWSGGSIGSGYVFNGHSDKDPIGSLAIDLSSTEGSYFWTGDNSEDLELTNGMEGRSQKRTLELSNGGTLWDFAGNVAEYTSGKITGRQPGYEIDTYLPKTREWDDNSLLFGSLPLNSLPPFGFNSSSGIGMITSSYYSIDVERAFVRGGYFGGKMSTGIYSLNLSVKPTDSASNIGFRATCDPN